MVEFDADARDEGKCGYIGGERDSPCGLAEGWGYENATSGFCSHHGNRGAKEGNGNREKYSLQSDPGKYYDRQSDAEQDRIDSWAESWARRGGYGGLGFHKMFQTHAIKLHQIETADEKVGEEGVIKERVVDRTESGDPIVKDEEHPAFLLQGRALKDITRFLKDFGCLDDPDSAKADATESVAAMLGDDS